MPWPLRWSPAASREIARPETQSIIRPSTMNGAKLVSTASSRTARFGSVISQVDPPSSAIRFATPPSATLPYVPTYARLPCWMNEPSR
nr:hypothetical protein [Kribbella jejuensis]